MRVLMITQKIDPDDALLGFTIRWIQALAARVEHLDVLALAARKTALPENVTVWSMGKEHGASRVQELRAFHDVLSRTAGKVDAIFCHMIPRYAWLSAPYAMQHGKPIFLWYTHRQISAELRLAVLVSRNVMTAVPESFPLVTPKLRVLGHGIDADYYTPRSDASQADGLPVIAQVARLMPIKHQTTLIKALGTGLAARVALVGGVPSGEDQTYLTQLETLVKDLGLSERVSFTGALTIEATRALVGQTAVAVNLSPPGLFDKAALESMLMAIPTVVANPAFDPVLGADAPRLRVAAPDDVQGLTERLTALLALPSAERRALGMRLREKTAALHGLDKMMDRMVKVMGRQETH